MSLSVIVLFIALDIQNTSLAFLGLSCLLPCFGEAIRANGQLHLLGQLY